MDIKHFELRENHDFTQFVGKLMFGTYSAIMVVVLINMLIAMLSNCYQYISVSSSRFKIKYGRSRPSDLNKWPIRNLGPASTLKERLDANRLQQLESAEDETSGGLLSVSSLKKPLQQVSQGNATFKVASQSLV